jgi:uncharacterized protein (DUF305 family)
MSSPSRAQTSGAAQPSEGAGGAPGFERDYLEMMVDHHYMATRMAEACQTGGVRPELGKRADMMQAEQLREIGQMREWLRAWHDTDKSPELSDDDRSMIDRLERLSGDELEIEFISMMIDHHGTAIRKSEDAAGQFEHEELESFSRELIAKQGGERAEMQRWLREWHGRQ